jgi:hypothetical protein
MLSDAEKPKRLGAVEHARRPFALNEEGANRDGPVPGTILIKDDVRFAHDVG